MISWPVIVQFNGEDELMFIHDETEWHSDEDIHFHNYTDEDRLIDSNGDLYQLDGSKNRVEIKTTGMSLPLNEFEMLVKKHLVYLNQCCIAKFAIASFAEGMDIVKKTEE